MTAVRDLLNFVVAFILAVLGALFGDDGGEE